MDDGHLKIVNGIPTKIILSTESFSKQENKQLIAFLEQKYGLVFKTDKQNRIILYDQFQIRYFLFLISPYMQTCMYRKTITTFYLPIVPNHKRTTLYLPNSIPLKHPTKEINQTLQHLDQIIFAYKQNYFYDVYKQKVSLLQQNTKPYQIVIHCTNLKRLLFLKEATGLNFSKITELAFTI